MTLLGPASGASSRRGVGFGVDGNLSRRRRRMHRTARYLHLDAERGDLSRGRHQGQGHRFGTQAVELLHEFLRAGPLKNGLDNLLNLRTVVVFGATHAILDNIIPSRAPAEIPNNSKKSPAQG